MLHSARLKERAVVYLLEAYSSNFTAPTFILTLSIQITWSVKSTHLYETSFASVCPFVSHSFRLCSPRAACYISTALRNPSHNAKKIQSIFSNFDIKIIDDKNDNRLLVFFSFGILEVRTPWCVNDFLLFASYWPGIAAKVACLCHLRNRYYCLVCNMWRAKLNVHFKNLVHWFLSPYSKGIRSWIA